MGSSMFEYTGTGPGPDTKWLYRAENVRVAVEGGDREKEDS